MILLIRKILTAIFGKKQADDFFSGYVAKSSVQLFLMHCLALCLGFVSNYILIKMVGVSAYGSYVYIFNLLYLLVSFCLMGVDTLLVKKIAVYDTVSNYPGLKGIIFFSLIAVGLGSILVALVSKFLFGFAGTIDGKTTIDWFLLSVLSLTMLSVTAVNQASLQGLKKIVFSQVTEKVIRPLLTITLVVVFFYIRKAISLGELIWINVAAIGFAMLITSILHRKSIAFKLENIKPLYEIVSWLNASMSFFLVSILYMLNSRIDVFLLGLYQTNDEIGIYNIALRISEIIGFGLVIINFVLAPVVARLFANGEMAKLQQVVTRSSRAVLLISLPLAIIIMVFGHSILALFDVDFLNGHEALLILCAGQLANIVCGSVGSLLIMTGYQQFSIYSLIAGTVLNIVLNIILVPVYGLVGTAIATSVSMIVWNLLMYYFVRKKLNIHTTAFGVL